MPIGAIVFKKKTANADVAVGLDLDPSHIAAAEVHVNGAISVTRGAVADLRPGILRDGEVADPAALGEALKAFFAEHDLPKRVRLGVANQRIVVRTLDLPPLDDEKALAAAVRMEAPDHIPMPMDEAILDFQSLGMVNTSSGPRTRVIVAAARRDSIERLVGAAQSAGLQLVGIDLSAFAMIRALRPSGTGAMLFVNASGLTNIAVANETGCLFTRAAAGGIDAIVATLCERRGLTREHARAWMTHVGLVTPLEELEGDPDLLAATRAALEEGVHQLADTVRNSLNFYRTQESAERVERAVLTGPAVAVPGFAERLGEQLKLEIEPMLPAAGAEDLDLHRLTVAAGLAVPSVG
jgi:type IV pilus assembly protein PilM